MRTDALTLARQIRSKEVSAFFSEGPETLVEHDAVKDGRPKARAG